VQGDRDEAIALRQQNFPDPLGEIMNQSHSGTSITGQGEFSRMVIPT